MNPQLPLDVSLPARATFEEFVEGDNGQVVQALRRLAEGRGDTGQLFLSGPSASGKSHLLMAAVSQAAERGLAAAYLPFAELLDLDPRLLEGLAGHALLAFDDVHLLAGHAAWEAALFRLFNEARQRGGRLLFSARTGPATLEIALPDLRSRLAWGESYALQPLNDAGREALLLKRARQRGLQMQPQAAAWMVTHCSRDPRRLLELLARLDEASLASRRPLTLPFVREQLGATE